MTLDNEGAGSLNTAHTLQRATTHRSVDAPLCQSCQKQELIFFDPTCLGCLALLQSPKTTVAEIFAILRQWTPQTQQNIELIINEFLKINDSHINDRDGLTDMNILMYAAKSGTKGVGDLDTASRVVTQLLENGADARVASRWTNMTALHYAAYFDVSSVVKVLLQATQCEDLNRPCSEFEMGAPLHIACQNISLESVIVLLDQGANIFMKDGLGRTPLECIPAEDSIPLQQRPILAKLIKVLRAAESQTSPIRGDYNDDSLLPRQGKVTLQSMGLHLGDSVLVGGVKKGRIRYCGPTEFAGGIWAGIELDLQEGKNNGTVSGISYFECPAKHGIFAPISKVVRTSLNTSLSGRTTPTRKIHFGSPRVGHVGAKVDTGLKLSRSQTPRSSVDDMVEVGDRVIVAGQRKGIVRFVGDTKFASGLWYGVELYRPAGKNDGTVSGTRYFSCKARHGVFAPPSRIQKIYGSTDSLDSLSMGKSSLTRTDSQNSLTESRSRTPVNHRQKSAGSPWKSNGSSEMRLCEGMSVFCNSELGVIRYIGPAHFSDGTWLGVELRTPKGKNDGIIQGQRYFTCKINHGLLVRPSKVTVRGINGAKLLGDM